MQFQILALFYMIIFSSFCQPSCPRCPPWTWQRQRVLSLCRCPSRSGSFRSSWIDNNPEALFPSPLLTWRRCTRCWTNFKCTSVKSYQTCLWPLHSCLFHTWAQNTCSLLGWPPLYPWGNIIVIAINIAPWQLSSSSSQPGLHKLWYPIIRDTSTWSKFGAHGDNRDVFLFSNLGAFWFSENLIRYPLHICLREVKNNLFSFKNSYLRHFSWRF